MKPLRQFVDKNRDVAPMVASLMFSFSFCGSLFFHIEPKQKPPVHIIVPQRDSIPYDKNWSDCYQNACYPEDT